MKTLFTALLIANFLVEVPVGIMLSFFPEALLPAGQVEGIVWVRNYGVAAFAIGTLVFWVWRRRAAYGTAGVVLGFMMLFNWALMAALLTSGSQMAGAIWHGLVATLSTILYFQRAKWCSTRSD